MARNRRRSLKRPIPSKNTLKWRAARLALLAKSTPLPPSTLEPAGLAPGNSKIGATGTLYSTGFVWNLPSVATCPGASSWCRQHCYNADPRDSKFPTNEWQENWSWFLLQPDKLREKIDLQLSAAKPPVAVRIHSSGDFFSNEYIDFWRKIATDHSSVSFWTYTRSWTEPSLLDSLEALRQIPNLEVFASIDASMSPPPSGWRLSIVVEDTVDTAQDQDNLPCPEQFDKLSNCLSCGYCIRRGRGNVIFTLH